jgi:hypothetical protein
VFTSPMNGMLTGSGNTLSILQPGATPNSPMTTVARLQMTYPGWF